MNDPNEPFEQCFFQRQPQTPDEVDKALEALWVSEMAALRYGGKNPHVIARLRSRRRAELCDHAPEGQAWFKKLHMRRQLWRLASWWRSLFGNETR